MVKLKSQTELKKNIRFIGLFFIIAFFIMASRAYFLQMLTSSQLSKRIQNQYKSKISLTPRRGTIYDRNAMELAVSIDVQSLFARPHLVKDAKSVAKKLSSVLETSQTEILKKLTRKKSFVWIKRKLTPLQAEKITLLKIDGLGFVKETQRFYPNKKLAGQVIGFAGIDNQGLEGLELEYDSILKGKQRELHVDRDALGRYLFIEGITSDQIQGHDIVLTIDKNIQYIAERELQAAVSISQAKNGIAVVMEPWTGEVLALAIVPLFNPNQFSESKPEIWRNRAVTDAFEPGSTFKTFLVASALQEGITKPKDIFFCENGSYRVANKTIHDLHPHGWLTVARILKYSSNIGISKISRHLGKELFYQYIRKFGFGEETGIQFPIEASGFVPLPYRLSEHTQSAIGFGQGISVTPLQLACAYSAIANGGLLMRPYFVKKIIDSKGMTVQKNVPFIRHRVVSEKTALTVKKILKSVVSKGGTGEKAAVAGFTVAGKTGTSQKIENNKERYSSKKTVASFVGFAPADSPRITILVIIDEPQRMTYGGEIAAPTFSRMSHLILNYLHVAPDSTLQKIYKEWQETKIISSRVEELG
jgi:cell division protein FtsI (penicillin-binding protein 3)